MEETTVYQYFAANGALIYVGITSRGTRRLHEHADSKPWWRLATGCTLEHFDTREAALAREAQLITRYRPPYNTQLNPERAVPVEERAARRLRLAGSLRDAMTAQEMKKQRKRWYGLSKERKLIEPCIECGQRPGITGPSCLQCRQLRARTLPTLVEMRAELEADEAQYPWLGSSQQRLQGTRDALRTGTTPTSPAPPTTPERVANSTPDRA